MDVLKYIEFAWNRRKTKYGLALLAALLGSGAFTVSSKFGIGLGSKLGFITILEVLLFVWWCYDSGRLIRSTKKILVVYSLRAADADAQRVLATTIHQLTLKLDQLGLLSRFKIIELGSDAIADVSEAQRFSDKHKVNLLIHGTVTSGKIDSVHHFDLAGFFFTTHLQGLPEQPPLLRLISADLGLFTSNRPWIISETNDLGDIKSVASGLTEIVLSTTAIGLSLRNDTVETALVLMEALLPLLERRVNESKLPIKVDQKKKLVYIPIDVLRSGRLRSILCNIYLARSRHFIDKEDYTDAINVASKGLGSGADPISALAVMAIALFRDGKEAESEEKVDEMGRINARDPVYLVDKAFFDIRNKRYNEALSRYLLLLEVGLPDGSGIAYEVITFLSEIAASNKHECAYDFALGFMHFHFGDRDQSTEHLKTFGKNAAGHECYQTMLDYMKSISEQGA